MRPKLTIAIPHLDRTAMLKRAIEHALHQNVPAKVLVADQGHTEATAELMASYEDNPLVEHIRTDATCLHENWIAAATAAMDGGAEYVALAQDDDVVRYQYSERINMAFDAYPSANTWCARLNCAEDEENAIWFSGNGPMVPMGIIKNRPRVIPGSLMVPIAYFTSWALSPAVAFRAGEDYRDSLAEIPVGCDLYSERTILASMGMKGDQVCDPVVVGYWIHHGLNESYRQNASNQPEQSKVFFDWMDGMMDGYESWQEILLDWARMMPNTFLGAYLYGLEKVESLYSFDVAQILRLGLKEEVSYDEIRRRNRVTDVMPMVV